MVRPSENKEEGVGYRPSANSKGWIKKIGDKARSVMRTSPPMEGTQKRNSHPKSRQEEQHQSHLGHGPGSSPKTAMEGTKLPSKMVPGTAEAADRVGGSWSNQTYISPLPKATTASSPQAGGEAGGLPKLPLVPHSQTKDRHLDTYHQKRCPAQTNWHEPHVTQELRRKAKQRDQAVN